MIQLLQVFEKYHFVNNVICGRVANEVEKFYAAAAKEIYIDDATLAGDVELVEREKEDKFINHLKIKRQKKKNSHRNL